MMLLQGSRGSRRPGLWACLPALFAACVLAGGCRLPEGAVRSTSPLRVAVSEGEGVKTVDDATAAELVKRAAREPAPAAPVEAEKPSAPAVQAPTEPAPPAAAPALPAPAVEPQPAVELPALADPQVADKRISVDFNQVDIRIVLKTISDITGVNFLVDDSVNGTVTLISPTPVRVGDLYKVLQSILEVKGYAAVPAGHLVKIIPRAEAARQNLLVRVGKDPAGIPLDDGLVTQIMPLQYVTASEVSSLLSPLAGGGTQVAVNSRTNSLLVTGTSANIHYLAYIINQLDVPGAEEEMAVVPLRNGSAPELAAQITELLNTAGPAAGAQGGGTAVPGRAPKVLAETRTNSLVVVGAAKDVARVKALAEQLDLERPLEAGDLHVVYLSNAQAKDLVEPLSNAVQQLAGSGDDQARRPLQITADEATNALIITASPQDYRVIDQIIQKLDIPRDQVLVEMRIMEVSQDAVNDLGIEWATTDPAASSLRGFGYTNFGLRMDAATSELEGLAIGAFKLGRDGQTRIAAILRALASDSRVNLLSTPHILTSNHHEASITVAENIPFLKETRVTEVEPSAPTAINTFGFMDVGIKVNITPHISQGGLIQLAIDAEFTKLIEGATGLGPETPTTAVRRASTVVSIMDGATVVIGGLMRDDHQKIIRKVPLLGDIPLLGALFRRQKDTIQKTNLLLFITPYVLTHREELEAMTKRKESEAQLSPPSPAP